MNREFELLQDKVMSPLQSMSPPQWIFSETFFVDQRRVWFTNFIFCFIWPVFSITYYGKMRFRTKKKTRCTQGKWICEAHHRFDVIELLGISAMVTLILGQYKPVYDSWCQFQTFTQILFKLENWVYRYGGNTCANTVHNRKIWRN